MCGKSKFFSGKEEYSVEEIKYMLETQRKMIFNDVNRMTHQSRTENERKIIEYLKNPRKVKI